MLTKKSGIVACEAKAKATTSTPLQHQQWWHWKCNWVKLSARQLQAVFTAWRLAHWLQCTPCRIATPFCVALRTTGQGHCLEISKAVWFWLSFLQALSPYTCISVFNISHHVLAFTFRLDGLVSYLWSLLKCLKQATGVGLPSTTAVFYSDVVSIWGRSMALNWKPSRQHASVPHDGKHYQLPV